MQALQGPPEISYQNLGAALTCSHFQAECRAAWVRAAGPRLRSRGLLPADQQASSSTSSAASWLPGACTSPGRWARGMWDMCERHKGVGKGRCRAGRCGAQGRRQRASPAACP